MSYLQRPGHQVTTAGPVQMAKVFTHTKGNQGQSKSLSRVASLLRAGQPHCVWSTRHALSNAVRNPEGNDVVGGTSIASVRTPKLGYSNFVSAPECCPPAGTPQLSQCCSPEF